MKYSILPVLVWTLPLAGCAVDLAPQPVLPVETEVGTEVAIKSAAARPLQSGLLALSPDGTFALASDDVGTAVHVIRLSTEQLTSTKVALDAGDEPGRAALTDTHAYITLPGAGGVAVVELASATVSDRWEVCPAPQSAAVDGASLHVACRDGDLVTLSLADGLVERTISLDDDLRDVLVVESGLVVSRLGTAELVWLDVEGAIIDRTVPPVPSGSEAAVAWRTLLASDGRVLVAHQEDSDQQLDFGYSGGECGSITMPTVTGFAPPGVELAAFPSPAGESLEKARKISRMSTPAGGGTFDVTVQGSEMIVIFPGNEFRRRFELARSTDTSASAEPTIGPLSEFPSVHRFTIGVDDFDCSFGSTAPEEDTAAPVAIATATAGPLSGRSLILTHSPSTVRVLDSPLTVGLHHENRASSGLELFQMTVGSGISCASCHPGGRADARTWNLARGPRRTQPLEGGVSQRGAFHWDAEFTSFSDLIDDVMTGRMGLMQELTTGSKTALLTFLDGIPAAAAPAHVDEEGVARGRALFESEATECASCHSGPSLTNNAAFDVGTGGVFVTPSLIGVGYREPLMHDGCATDLADRFGPCGGGDEHGKVSQLTDADVADLVAYMKTL
jgi:mono/diheme cytochrome c family protein